MTAISPSMVLNPIIMPAPDTLFRRLLGSGRVVTGGVIVLAVFLVCIFTIPLTRSQSNRFYYDRQDSTASRLPPALTKPNGALDSNPWQFAPERLFGTDPLGRSVLSRCLFGGCISLTIGLAAAAIAMVLGVSVGLVAGYRGGWVDSLLMRLVDILYGLPYILIVVLIKLALEDALFVKRLGMSKGTASIVTMFIAIGSVSWLTMARVVRGQVLSLRSQPFIEAARAAGLTETRIFAAHLLPNLVGPVIVYATLTVPRAILEESFLSFLGVGVQPPVPTWGSLAADGISLALNPIHSRWWLLVFPCSLLAVTLLALNFLGDGLRDVIDPRRGVSRL